MKSLLSLLLLCALGSSAAAQEKVFHFGPKAGLNLSDLSNQPDVNIRAGYYAGLLFNIRLNAHWRLQPEVFFSAQGGNVSGAIKDIKKTEHYNYLAFPVLAQYHFTDRLYLEAGLQAAILVNPRLREYVPYPGASYTGHHENMFDFLIPAGAGYQLNRQFGFNLRYVQGVTGIRRSAAAPRQRNQVLQAGAYMFF